MRRFVLLFVMLVLCVGTATAKRDKGSYVTQYLALTEQVNTALDNLHRDVLIACGEIKPKRQKSRQRKSGEENARTENLKEQELSTTERDEKKARKEAAKELSPAELAALRQELVAELADRVRPIRRRAGRLREIGPVPAELKSSQLHVQGYIRHVNAAVDALKQAAYSGQANVAAINAHMVAAKNEAAQAERMMGQYLDSKPVILPVAQR